MKDGPPCLRSAPKGQPHSSTGQSESGGSRAASPWENRSKSINAPKGQPHTSPGKGNVSLANVPPPWVSMPKSIGALKGRNTHPPAIIVMPQSLVKNLVHLVYSTKHRSPWIPQEVRPRLYAYQSGIFGTRRSITAK